MKSNFDKKKHIHRSFHEKFSLKILPSFLFTKTFHFEIFVFFYDHNYLLNPYLTSPLGSFIYVSCYVAITIIFSIIVFVKYLCRDILIFPFYISMLCNLCIFIENLFNISLFIQKCKFTRFQIIE